LKGNIMPVHSQKSVEWNGHRGTATTSFEAVMRDDPSWATRGITMGEGTDGSIGYAIQEGKEGETWEDPYTGELEFISYQAIVVAYPDIDLHNAYLRIESKFVPAEGELIYPSDMAEEMRRKGWPESEIQDLLAWERSIRNQADKE
jgi:hypothetical protein